jgi:hypothetical protein
VEKIVHLHGKVSLHGSVPTKNHEGNTTETNKLAFCIESEITREERYLERARTAEAMRYQRSVRVLEK